MSEKETSINIHEICIKKAKSFHIRSEMSTHMCRAFIFYSNYLIIVVKK